MAVQTPIDHLALASECYRQGRLGEAAQHCQRVLKRQPQRFDALQLLFGVRFAEADFPEALAVIKRAVKAHPNAYQGHNNLGLVLHTLGKRQEALASYGKALAIRSDFPQALNNRGNTLAAIGRLEEALADYDRAIALAPDYAEAHYNRGTALSHANRHRDAIPSYEKAIALRPDYVEAINNIGIAYSHLKRQGDALACFERALRINPDYAEAHNCRGNVLCLLNRYEDAVESYKRAIEIGQNIESGAHSNLIFALDFVAGKDFAVHQAERHKWNDLHARSLAKHIRPHENRREPDRKLRVGYVSADFRRHSAQAAFGPILRNHDKGICDVVLYSTGTVEDEITESLRKTATEWTPITFLSDDEAAKRIRADRIDILVDLSGHSAGNRLLLFARKPAPIQVTAWGHATGTGIPAIDYLFTDPVTIPVDVRHLFAEKPYDLPCLLGYEAPKESPPIAPLPAAATGRITFGSYNRISKMSADSIALWAQMLHEISDARLALKDTQLSDPAEQKRLEGLFAEHGIASERLKFLPGTSHFDHLAAYAEIDIALDPMPMSGGVTTMESLWMGVPVVTLPVPSISGRGAAAIMTAIGLPEWVATSKRDYIAIAQRMAANLDALAGLRPTLRQRLADSPVGNPRTYCRAVEDAYRAMWRWYCENGARKLPRAG